MAELNINTRGHIFLIQPPVQAERTVWYVWYFCAWCTVEGKAQIEFLVFWWKYVLEFPLRLDVEGSSLF